MEEQTKPKVSKAQQRATNKYLRKAYDRINVTLHKGDREKLKEAAAAAGESVNAYILEAIRQRMIDDHQ